jgi:magnesium-transporting ATPase (P-type)
MSEVQKRETSVSDDRTIDNNLKTNPNISWLSNTMIIVGIIIILAGTILLIKVYITGIPFTITTQNREIQDDLLLNYYASMTFIMSAVIMGLIRYIDRCSFIKNKKIKSSVFIGGLCLMFCSLLLYYCEYRLKNNW